MQTSEIIYPQAHRDFIFRGKLPGKPEADPDVAKVVYHSAKNIPSRAA